MLNRLFTAAIRAAQPRLLVEHHAEVVHGHWRYRYQGIDIDVPLPQAGKVWLCGAGKAVVPFAAGMARTLGNNLQAGLVVTKHDHGETLDPRIRVVEAAHPIPDESSEMAASELMQFLEQVSPEDLVFFLLTGGASALLAAPVDGITLADKQTVTRLLLASGADIHEINTVRKHLSRLKGGGIARLVSPARLVALAVSDVLDDDPASIGSGPTVPDPSTFADCLEILRRYRLLHQVPRAVLRHLEQGPSGRLTQTPVSDTDCFRNSSFTIIARLADALLAIEREGVAGSLFTRRVSQPLQGDVSACAALLVKELQLLAASPERPAMLLAAGEPTVELSGAGKGGRMQHLALLLATLLEGRDGIVGLAAGTDGTDGPTDVAGAYFAGDTVSRARTLGLDPLHHLSHLDAYPFFSALDDHLLTGPTGTNVMDIVLILLTD